MFSLPKLYTNAIAALIFLPMFLDVLVWSVDRDRKVLFEIAAEGGENTWKRVQSQDPKLTSRELFTYALALYEAGKYLERIPILMETAARMQDRNSESRTYGNFLWYSDEHSIRDLNAVEFCMMAGAPLWIRHHKELDDFSKQELREIFDYAVKACIRRGVGPNYTNISLMNALNLILLGESLEQPEIADEGYSRLNRFCIYTWQNGIHEYNSPTYAGVDLECLGMLEAFCKHPEARRQARTLLKLFWTDLALNWHMSSERLWGSCSREYRYLRSTGHLDQMLWMHGWLSGSEQRGAGILYPALTKFHPEKTILCLHEGPFPRLIRSIWGPETGEFRTHYMLNGISLSSSAANYGPMDLPLTIDLVGPRDAPRCYFIPDGRGDPYGIKKIPAGAHQKAQHLRPFWTAAQRNGEALGLVVYREKDFLQPLESLESHIVLRRDVDSFWIGERKVSLAGNDPISLEIPAGECITLRQGKLAVAIRTPWALGVDGEMAPARLIYDGNKLGAVRLTVDHHADQSAVSSAIVAAAFHVRITDDIASEEGFLKWLQTFSNRDVQITASVDGIEIRTEAPEGSIVVAANKPFLNPARIIPEPSRVILEVDGRDVGREILGELAIIQEMQQAYEAAPEIVVPPKVGIIIEAEEASRVPLGFQIVTDPNVSGKKYVWTYGEIGSKEPAYGGLLWKVCCERPQSCYVWARVLTPTSSDDSFYIGFSCAPAERSSLIEWHTGVNGSWQWMPVHLKNKLEPLVFRLDPGVKYFQVHARESGARVDAIWIGTDPKGPPHTNGYGARQ